jgi:hypothetical protein
MNCHKFSKDSCVLIVDTRDHHVDESIKTMKYLNDPDNGCIGPQMSP